MLIDLSHAIYSGMPQYPGDKETFIGVSKTVDKDGYMLSEYQTSMHNGTHIDFPAHFLSSGKRACDFKLDSFVGKGLLIDARGKDVIQVTREFDKIDADDIVLFFTGFSDLFNKPEYYTNHPVISEKAAKILCEKKIKAVGLDTPSPDYYPFDIHRILLQNDILIIENMNNIEKLHEHCKDGFIERLYIFPLITGIEACQIRAVAEII